MRTRPGICARKRRFGSVEEAEAVAAAAQVTLRAYRCELCREWHLTSRTKGMRAPYLRHSRESGNPKPLG